MKTSSVYKTGNNTTLGNGSKGMGSMGPVGLNPNEFIKGTSVTKDFQLIAEPLQPKLNQHQM
jgi:hypothetical protein